MVDCYIGRIIEWLALNVACHPLGCRSATNSKHLHSSKGKSSKDKYLDLNGVLQSQLHRGKEVCFKILNCDHRKIVSTATLPKRTAERKRRKRLDFCDSRSRSKTRDAKTRYPILKQTPASPLDTADFSMVCEHIQRY